MWPLTHLQVEGPSLCNAACPMCIRFTKTGQVLPEIQGRQLMMSDYVSLLSPDILSPLTSLSLIGNYGDPALLPLYTWLTHVRTHSPTSLITMDTNGGMHTPSWWELIGNVLAGTPHLVTFNLDGLEDTLAVHRRKVRYDAVIANLRAFLQGGGQARWTMLVFKHNEHQVEEARRRAVALGCREFQVRISDRFYDNQGRRRPPVISAGITLEEPETPAYRYTPPPWVDPTTVPIQCLAEQGQYCYLDYAGRVWPCCYVAAIYADDPDDTLGMQRIHDLLHRTGGLDALDATKYGIRACMQSTFFQQLMQSWATPQRPQVCAAVCGLRHRKYEQTLVTPGVSPRA